MIEHRDAGRSPRKSFLFLITVLNVHIQSFHKLLGGVDNLGNILFGEEIKYAVKASTLFVLVGVRVDSVLENLWESSYFLIRPYP